MFHFYKASDIYAASLQLISVCEGEEWPQEASAIAEAQADHWKHRGNSQHEGRYRLIARFCGHLEAAEGGILQEAMKTRKTWVWPDHPFVNRDDQQEGVDFGFDDPEPLDDEIPF